MGLLSKIKAQVKSKGGFKNVVAVGKSIIQGKGVTANVKNPTVKKVMEKALGTKTGIAVTALAGASAATAVKYGAKAIASKAAAKGAAKIAIPKAAAQKLPIGAKVKNIPTDVGSIAQPAAIGKAPESVGISNITKKASRGVYRMGRSKKKSLAWYKRQTALLKAKREYAKARGY